MTARLCDSNDYDAADDLSRSIEYAYEAIRTRVARGGHGWRGWPESATCGRARNGDVEPAEPRA
jgi:hypothetical protein